MLIPTRLIECSVFCVIDNEMRSAVKHVPFGPKYAHCIVNTISLAVRSNSLINKKNEDKIDDRVLCPQIKVFLRSRNDKLDLKPKDVYAPVPDTGSDLALGYLSGLQKN